jgi:hypothetical protein
MHTRVRRSYSLKAKISENVGIFVLALKRKKVVFFRFVRMEAKHSKQRKKWKRTESEAKREAKNPTLFPLRHNYFSSAAIVLVYPT